MITHDGRSKKLQAPHRFMVIRERLQEDKPSVGRKRVEVPGYTFQIFATNCGGPVEQIWQTYNQRADVENRIEELKNDLENSLQGML